MASVMMNDFTVALQRLAERRDAAQERIKTGVLVEVGNTYGWELIGSDNSPALRKERRPLPPDQAEHWQAIVDRCNAEIAAIQRRQEELNPTAHLAVG